MQFTARSCSHRPFTAVRLATCVALALLIALPAAAQTPPRDLKLVGDHWTAWDPPTSFPEGAEIHIIERGDTLWDLAERFLGNPYLWPQLWEPNRYIEDAHWIYPGDPLVVAIQVEPLDTLEDTAAGGDATEVTDARGAELLGQDDDWFRASGRIAQLGTADDIYCSGYIGTMDEAFPHQVIGSEFDTQLPRLDNSAARAGKTRGTFGIIDQVKYGLNIGDIVYVDGGRAAGLTPGDLLSAVEPGKNVSHPLSGEPFGRYYAHTGRLRVLSVQEDRAIAEIALSCHPIKVGALLKRFVPEPIPSERRTPLRPVNQPISNNALDDLPVILMAKDDIVSIGQDHVVFLDRGEAQGLIPGDVFTIYRRSLNANPPVVIGEVAVLSVQPDSAVAKVLESRYPVLIGDPVDLK